MRIERRATDKKSCIRLDVQLTDKSHITFKQPRVRDDDVIIHYHHLFLVVLPLGRHPQLQKTVEYHAEIIKKHTYEE